MLQIFLDIGAFGLKVLIVAVAFGLLAILIIGLIRRGRSQQLGEISVLPYNDHFDDLRETLELATQTNKKKKPDKKKADTRDEKGRVFVMDFHGDIAATAVNELREMITAVLSVAKQGDEVVLRLESSGGMVHDYGLGASQLVRLRDAEIPLTVCVDKIAASGGYMMACVANKVVAAPFSVIGSIGVMVMMPNFNRLLKRFDIDYLEVTAGEYKTTLTPMGEVTEKGRAKTEEELALTHDLFKSFIREFRPDLEIEQVSTGESWHGIHALDRKLVDELRTSDDYLFALNEERRLFRLEYEAPRSVREKLAGAFGKSLENGLVGTMERIMDRNRWIR